MERQRELDLAGKVAIVTGASRGMGRQAAINFARRGAKTVLAARTLDNDPTQLGSMAEALQWIKDFGGEAIAVKTDLGNRADRRNLIDQTVEQFGGVDILVNNAALTVGPAWQKQFLDLAYDEWIEQFEVNTHAPFELMQLSVPIMAKRGGGRIVNLSTGNAEVFRQVEEHIPPESSIGRNFVVPGYKASKRALDRVNSMVAGQLRAMNIYCIGLHPGWVETETVTERFQRQNITFKEGDLHPVPMGVPARMMVYFAACENPDEYTGRLFWAEREMAEMGISMNVMEYDPV